MSALERTFTAKVKGKSLTFNNPSLYSRHMQLFEDGDNVLVTIKRQSRSRSNRQNAYYWGVVLDIIAKDTGHTPEELHEIYKRMFLKKKIINYKGKEFPVPGTTTDQDTNEFSEYIERIRAEAASMGILVPDPDGAHF